MRRTFSLLLSLAIGGSIFAISAGTASAQSFTTRIETKPYYGAVVTLEHGVRVYRPLPPDRQVIINPGRVPLNLSFSDSRYYNYGAAPNYGVGGVVGGGIYGNGDGTYYAPIGGPFFGKGRGLRHGSARSRVYQWRPGFYHIGGPRGFRGPRNGGMHGKPGPMQPMNSVGR
jgi:hypothetical protein